MFGAIVGSTGLFAAKRISRPLNRHFEEEIGHGRILISVRVENVTERDRLIAAMNGWGASDVHYSRDRAA